MGMDAESGATEAFQLSDVTVQMAAEGVLMRRDDAHYRSIPTSDPIRVDGAELRELDSVLSLVNTAVLPHTGLFAGNAGTNGKKRRLTAKRRKSLLDAIDRGGQELFTMLCDFHLLSELDLALPPNQMNDLCHLVL